MQRERDQHAPRSVVAGHAVGVGDGHVLPQQRRHQSRRAPAALRVFVLALIEADDRDRLGGAQRQVLPLRRQAPRDKLHSRGGVHVLVVAQRAVARVPELPHHRLDDRRGGGRANDSRPLQPHKVVPHRAGLVLHPVIRAEIRVVEHVCGDGLVDERREVFDVPGRIFGDDGARCHAPRRKADLHERRVVTWVQQRVQLRPRDDYRVLGALRLVHRPRQQGPLDARRLGRLAELFGALVIRHARSGQTKNDLHTLDPVLDVVRLVCRPLSVRPRSLRFGGSWQLIHPSSFPDAISSKFSP